MKPCYCVCHTHPSAYPTSTGHPCYACGHVHEQGRMIGSINDGWVGRVIWRCPDCGEEYIEGEPPEEGRVYGQSFVFCSKCGRREYQPIQWLDR